MLYLETVESSTLELLKKMQKLPVLNNTRLVGGDCARFAIRTS